MSQDLTQRVASNVRAELARRRVSQARLGKALSLSQPQVSERLLGRIAFDTGELETVAEFLNVTVAHLLDAHVPAPGSPPPSPPPPGPSGPTPTGPGRVAA